MSWIATAWVKRCSFPGGKRKAVMMVIADSCNEDLSQLGIPPREGWACCPAGLDSIAAGADTSRSTVKRVLAVMEAAGVIKREARYRTWGDGGRTSDLVWLQVDRMPMQVPADFQPPAKEVSEAQREACRRGGQKSAEKRRGRPDEPVDNPAAEPVKVVVNEAPMGDRGQSELGGLGVNLNWVRGQSELGSGSPVNSQEPLVEPAVEPIEILFSTEPPVGRPQVAHTAEIPSSAEEVAPAPDQDEPRLTSDQIRRRALGASRGRRRLAAVDDTAADAGPVDRRAAQ